jgi:hypothetical protein
MFGNWRLQNRGHMQLMLFETKISNEEILERLLSSEQKLERNRKSLHAKNGNLAKEISELKHEFEMLKAAICRLSK